MAVIYYHRILAGTKTYAQVPRTWKAGVKELFVQAVENGEITPEQYEEYIGEPYEDNE